MEKSPIKRKSRMSLARCTSLRKLACTSSSPTPEDDEWGKEYLRNKKRLTEFYQKYEYDAFGDALGGPMTPIQREFAQYDLVQRAPFPIQLLPIEIRYKIMNYLSFEEIKTVRCVCKEFAKAGKRFLKSPTIPEWQLQWYIRYRLLPRKRSDQLKLLHYRLA